MSGMRLAAALAVILLLTFVLPPLAARHVHGRRIAAAQAEVARLAQELSVPRGASVVARVFHGPGEVPKSSPEATWLEGVSVAPLPSVANAAGPDPWGNHYLVSVAGDGAVCVLSAGPNGIVETQNPCVVSPGSIPPGDDLLAVR